MAKFTWVICTRCDGHGKIDGPAYSNGITSSEWADMHDDDRDAYMSGVYDVACNECAGRGSVQVPNMAELTFAEKRVLADKRRRARWDAEDRATMRRESGCSYLD